ncbi:hypothetical protein AN395_00192 [Pseudoalteromonas sp. P1-30]|jgi:hypothetical protein|uniref:DUF4234 domain-containing protein n=1 Tax=Pseudoalteromonas sp. P1-30 TaxID=1723760 RepID=UPI0006D5EC44|nr:DUF4234 domain-containing protein [Pseudoalteromonas sp. P1-30]KPV93066.1 hypothetical protein AN395_00192 [Pseudoalteromonas sp. P1-30]
MSSITELKDSINTKTLNLVLLTFVTAGIYAIVWMFINTPKLEKLTSKKIADNTFLIWLAVCVGLGGAFAGSGEESLDIIAGLLTIASWVLYIIWSFRAKSALQEYALTEHKVDLRMNGIYTFFLTIYYINYCINDLPEAQRKQQILSGQEPKTDNL